MSKWNKGEILALLGVIVAVVGVVIALIIPETRCWALKKDCSAKDNNNSVIPQVTSTPPPSNTDSTPLWTDTAFTSPESGAVVPKESDVTGTVRQLASGEKLWIYVDAPGAGKMFVSPIYTRGGTWKTSLWLGSDLPADVGASFEVGLIIADDALSQKLEAGTNGKGLDVLPSKARRLAPITLTRK